MPPLIALALLAAAVAGSEAGDASAFPREVAQAGVRAAPPAASQAAASWPSLAYPARRRVVEAERFAASRPGTVSFAVLDAKGGVRGLESDRRFSSASVSKALLLAAEVRRLRESGERLDEAARSTLEAMIELSDNDAAGVIYARVGDPGMEAVVRRAGMRAFEITPGYWGGAQVTAGDLARFFFRLERNLAGPHREFAMGLLAHVTSTQRWGIPEGAGRGWRVWFKGGWRPPESEETSGPVTHQAALLRHVSGQRVAIAVLSDQAPGETSFETVEGITERLLSKPPRDRRWPAP